MSYILGLDLGETSLGIAILNEKNGEPISLDSMGVRIFPDGREDKTREPLAVARRNARGIRRNIDRRLRRKEELIKFLIDNNLISQNKDKRLNLKSLNPYALRTKALDEQLTLNELSRALIHINQRRGFKSNRKSDKNQKDSSAMKSAIKETAEKIQNNNCRTLGEYLYSLQEQNTHNLLRVRPEEIKKEVVKTIKDKKTKEEKEEVKIANSTEYNYFPSRELYKNEVQLILDKQSKLHDLLNEVIFDEDTKKEITIKDKIIDIIFYQRDLKPQAVGKCQFEDGEYRIARAHPLFQEYRILCELNNLELIDFNDGVCLSKDDRNKLKDLLTNKDKLTFAGMRKALNIKNILFNLEDERRKELQGNITFYELSKDKNFGDVYTKLPTEKQYEIVEMLTSDKKDNEIEHYLKNNFPQLTKEQIENILIAKIPDGYANLSKKAVEKLLPHLRNGLRYDEACEVVYSSHSMKNNKFNLTELPYYGEILYKSLVGGTFSKEDKENLEKYYGKITNPTIHIGLKQLEKCINEIIRERGKPSYIAIELARELKLSKKQKDNLKKEQTQNTKDNERINKELEKLGIKQSYDNRMLYKIWERLSENALVKKCPFCGKQISASDLFNGQFHIEHLLPFSKTYDDSINNKVISCNACNEEKGDRTPFEAWGHDKERYNEIMARAEFLPKKVQWRFSKDAMEKFKDENKVLARMLSDTQYLSKAASEYLSCLFPDDKKKYIRTLPGKLTSLLRHHWGLNSLISGDEDIKDRKDHRHHAIDAFVAACTTQSTLNKVSKASGRRFITKDDKLIKDLEPPFEAFNLQDMKRVVDNIIVSFKPDCKNVEKAKINNKTIGQLHEETNFGIVNINGKEKIATRIKLIDLVPDQQYKIDKVLKNINLIADRKIRMELFKEFIDNDKIYEFLTDDFYIKSVFEEDNDENQKNKKEKKEAKELFNKLLENLKIKEKNDAKNKLNEYSRDKKVKRIRIHQNFNKDSYIKFNKKSKFAKNIGTDIKKIGESGYKLAKSGNNYCAEIYIPNKDKNKDKWCVEIISNFNAHKKDFKPKWRIEEPEAKLVMRLFINDMVEIEINDKNKNDAIKKLLPFAKDNKIITRVKKMTNGMIYLRPHNIAKENKDGELTWQGSSEGLRIANAKKVRISPLGKITYLKK